MSGSFGISSLSTLGAGLLAAIFLYRRFRHKSLKYARDAPIDDEVEALARLLTRRGRYLATDWSPALCISLLGFDPRDPRLESQRWIGVIQRNTQCIFARRAVIWGSRCRDDNVDPVAAQARKQARNIADSDLALAITGSSVDDVIEHSLRAIEVFCATQRVDGFALAVREPCGTLKAHARAVNLLLRGLSRAAAQHAAATTPTDHCTSDNGSSHANGNPTITNHAYDSTQRARRIRAKDACASSIAFKRGWVFELFGRELFVTTFSTAYGEDHPRYAFGGPDGGGHAPGSSHGHSVVLLQPYESFLLHRAVGSDTPAQETRWDRPESARDRIRCAYRAAGRPYFVPENVSRPVAFGFVPPADGTSPEVVRWWEMSGEDE